MIVLFFFYASFTHTHTHTYNFHCLRYVNKQRVLEHVVLEEN
jgi:hypothetical protein